MNHNERYPQLTQFLAHHIQPENAGMLPRQTYTSKDGKRKQTEYQPYILISDGSNLNRIVICWNPNKGHTPQKFGVDTWRSAPICDGWRLVTVTPTPADFVITLTTETGWTVTFVGPIEFAEQSRTWKL